MNRDLLMAVLGAIAIGLASETFIGGAAGIFLSVVGAGAWGFLCAIVWGADDR